MELNVPVSTATTEEARQFTEETRVDVLAPAVGNMHGMLKSMLEGARQKRLDLGRIRELKKQLASS